MDLVIPLAEDLLSVVLFQHMNGLKIASDFMYIGSTLGSL